MFSAPVLNKVLRIKYVSYPWEFFILVNERVVHVDIYVHICGVQKNERQKETNMRTRKKFLHITQGEVELWSHQMTMEPKTEPNLLLDLTSPMIILFLLVIVIEKKYNSLKTKNHIFNINKSTAEGVSPSHCFPQKHFAFLTHHLRMRFRN